MPPRPPAHCQICSLAQSKYACPKCEVLYCSVACYKQHKSNSCSAQSPTNTGAARADSSNDKSAISVRIDSMTHDALPDASRYQDPGLLVLPVNAAPSLDSDAGGAETELYPSRVSQEERFGAREAEVGSHKTEMEMDTEMERKSDDDSNNDGVRVVNGLHTEPTAGEESNRVETDVVLDTSKRKYTNGENTVSEDIDTEMDASIPSVRPLRKLSSLKWPYVPDASSYPDPLTRDDPKPLTLAQYEAIARSPSIRHALAAHPRLPTLLRALDAQRGVPREEALRAVLGVKPEQSGFELIIPSPAGTVLPRSVQSASAQRLGDIAYDEEDMQALRDLAEAVERAVRSAAGAGVEMGYGGAEMGLLGLDWEGEV